VITFALMLGAFMLLMLVTAGYLFRTTAAPLWMKLAIPSLALLISWWTPTQVAALMGYPFATDFASLPQTAELVAFVPHDEEQRVDLWLREGSKDPRSYSIPLTDGLKATLQQAKAALAHGPVAVGKKSKPGKKRPHQFGDIDGGNAPYTLLDNAFSLPKKDDK
jgi:hypothetical protein